MDLICLKLLLSSSVLASSGTSENRHRASLVSTHTPHGPQTQKIFCLSLIRSTRIRHQASGNLNRSHPESLTSRSAHTQNCSQPRITHGQSHARVEWLTRGDFVFFHHILTQTSNVFMPLSGMTSCSSHELTCHHGHSHSHSVFKCAVVYDSQLLIMVLGILTAIAACPAIVGTTEAIRQGQRSNAREGHRGRKSNLTVSCLSPSRCSREVNGGIVILHETKVCAKLWCSESLPWLQA